MRVLFTVAVVCLTACNKPPSSATVQIGEDGCTEVNEPLKAHIIREADDPDGDTIQYRYSWFQNSNHLADLTSDTVPAARTSRGDTWMVEVVPHDGSEDGPATKATVILGTPTSKHCVKKQVVAYGHKLGEALKKMRTGEIKDYRLIQNLFRVGSGRTKSHMKQILRSQNTEGKKGWRYVYNRPVEDTVVVSDDLRSASYKQEFQVARMCERSDFGTPDCKIPKPKPWKETCGRIRLKVYLQDDGTWRRSRSANMSYHSCR